MKHLLTVAMIVLLHMTPMAAQEPISEAFTRFRAQVIERFEDSVARFGPGLRTVRPGTPNPLPSLFGTDNTRVITAAEIVFPNEHRLSITFSTSSTDLFLSETTKTDGDTVVTVFHTDLSLMLRAIAVGASDNNLQLVANDSNAAFEFQEVLRFWEGHLPRILERRAQQTKSLKTP
jgi:hypothetical protein